MRGNGTVAFVLAGLVTTLWSCGSEKCGGGCLSVDVDASAPEDQIQNDTTGTPDLPTDLDAPDLADQADTVPVPEDVQPMLPCIQATPLSLSFPVTPVGESRTMDLEIRPCHTSGLPLEVYQVHVLVGDEYSTEFSVDVSQPDVTPSPENPLVLLPNQHATILVTYTPTGAVVLPGKLEIVSNATESTLLIDLDVGSAIDPVCPKAVIECDEGSDVAPFTVLHLSASGSVPAGDAITSYKWTATTPLGTPIVFVPSASFPDPTVQVTAAGRYMFALEVTDAGGITNCMPTEYEVMVTPSEAIWVELFWNLPEGSEQSGVNADALDLDVHFANQLASMPDQDLDGLPDPWFDSVHDCWSDNPTPDWGDPEASTQDNPVLSGNGFMEAISLQVAATDESYHAGVYVEDDKGLGPLAATVRVHIYGVMVFETDAEVSQEDMWNVATVDWPSGKVTTVFGPDGEPHHITPQYQKP